MPPIPKDIENRPVQGGDHRQQQHRQESSLVLREWPKDDSTERRQKRRQKQGSGEGTRRRTKDDSTERRQKRRQKQGSSEETRRRTKEGITVVQARVLSVLNSAWFNGDGLLSTRRVNVAAGYSPTSATANRGLYGIPIGSTSGRPRPGLLSLGLVEKIQLDVEGVSETVWEITEEGRNSLKAYLEEHGPLPEVAKDAKKYTNTNRLID